MKSRFPMLLILTLLIGAALLTGCAQTPAPVGDDAPAATDTAATDTAVTDAAADAADESEAEPLPEPVLPDADFTDQTLTVLVRNTNLNGVFDTNGVIDIYAEAETGDTISDAVYNRNLALYDKLGITVQEVRGSDGQVNDMLYRDVAGGEAAYDLVDIDFQQSYVAASNELLTDLDTLDYLDLSQPWWDHPTNEDFTLAGHQYYAIGNANLNAMQGTWTLVFNKDLMRDLGYEENYLYDLVRDGKWTLDAFYNVVKNYAADLNDDNRMTDADRYGMSVNGAALFGFVTNAGINILEKDENDEVRFCALNDRTDNILNKLSDVLSPRVTYNSSNSNQNVSGDNNRSDCRVFAEGRALFFSEGLGTIEYFRDMDADFGIIPHPKYTEADDYRTFIHYYTGCAFSVPVSASDPVKTAAVMEYMTYLSTDMILPVYYNRVLEGKFARDAASYEMITDYIMTNRTYDLGMANDIGGFSFSIYNMFLSNVKTFASTYARSERNMSALCDEINEAFR